MTTLGPTATKQSVLEKLLDHGMVLIALDARVAGVDVPAHLAGDAQLRLNLSYRFGLPMTVDADGVVATLTFAGVPHVCRLPWGAVYLLVSHASGQPYLFPDDVPAELLAQAPELAGRGQPVTTLHEPVRPKLSVVGQAPPAPPPVAAATPPDGPEPAPGGGRRRGHLRLVK